MEEPLRLSPLAWIEGEWTTAPPTAPRPPSDLEVVTWNTWFGGHMFEERTVALLAELERRSPHVIALQEVTAPLLAALADAAWVRRRYHLSQLDVRDYDVLLLSREPVRRITSLDLPTGMGRRLLVADLACGLRVATVHLESTSDCAAARAAQLRRILPYLARDPDVALVGDMNFRPGDRLEEAELDPSFRDVWPALHPAARGYTVDTERNAMRLAVRSTPTQKRIDRVFLRSAGWRATAIELLGTQPIDDDETFISDHFGLAVSLATSG